MCPPISENRPKCAPLRKLFPLFLDASRQQLFTEKIMKFICRLVTAKYIGCVRQDNGAQGIDFLRRKIIANDPEIINN
jgi:hypothetical protein